MKYKDYYAALEVPRDAGLDQIKKAYRKLARQHHPDVSHAAGAEARFKEAAEAYATLRNPDKRAAYDALGTHPVGEDFTPPPPWARNTGMPGQGMEDMDLEDLLSSLRHGRTGDGRAGTGGGAGGSWSGARDGGRASPRPARGRDIEATARLSLEDAVHGTTLRLDLGDGQARRSLDVTVPAGVAEGQRLRLRGQGGKGRHGGEDGDIYLHIALAPHPVFRADGHDLYFDLALSPWEAALGAELEVATLDRPVLLTVPPGSRSGRRLRLRGRGLSNGRNGRGDLYATVHVDVPATLTEAERALFGQLAALSNFNPRGTARKEELHETAAS